MYNERIFFFIIYKLFDKDVLAIKLKAVLLLLRGKKSTMFCMSAS